MSNVGATGASGAGWSHEVEGPGAVEGGGLANEGAAGASGEGAAAAATRHPTGAGRPQLSPALAEALWSAAEHLADAVEDPAPESAATE